MTERESHRVELVDDEGVACGQATVADAHGAPGLAHRAFSVHLLDSAGRLLLQQRAATKTRFPLRWANAACGHPAPGEPVIEAATRRLAEEIGLRAVALTEIGVYRYRAEDPATGTIEDEYDHVLLGIVEPAPGGLHPDPSEVAALRWITPTELMAALRERPEEFSPWLAGVTNVVTGSAA